MSYTADPREEELQLLLQLARAPRKRLVTNHPATLDIARRLSENDECVYFPIQWGRGERTVWGVEISAKGRRTMGIEADG